MFNTVLFIKKKKKPQCPTKGANTLVMWILGNH